MKQFTFRDPEGTIRWIPELLEDDTGLSGELIRGRMCELEDLLDGCSLDRLRELVEADRDGRCVVLPKDMSIYFLAESIDSGEQWVDRWPVKDVFFKCGFGLASLSYSVQDIGNKIYLTREAAEATLKARKQDG